MQPRPGSHMESRSIDPNRYSGFGIKKISVSAQLKRKEKNWLEPWKTEDEFDD